ncbi:cytokinin dehydrogenase 1-like [Curcuma longa]|uniref:cytokinin dehydrogenase 1-like n=1 Tax=Curcuma longa TaxID=136217 RepID=UPI003D9F0A27
MKVKCIRLLDTDNAAYTAPTESVISLPDEGSATFDFQEGFININKVGFLKYWMASFPFIPKDPAGAEQFVSDDKVLYCLEVAKYFNPENINSVNEASIVLPNQSPFVSTIAWSFLLLYRGSSTRYEL